MGKMSSISLSLGTSPTELRGVNNGSEIKLNPQATGGETRYLDAHKWLPAAAEVYNISKDLNDYIIVPVPCIITGIPNTNGDSATLRELLRFNPQRGLLAYRTWVAQPTYVEHDNKDYLKARGVILDTYLTRLNGYHGDLAKLVKLLAFDRTKDPLLAERILKREVNTYSMGMYFKRYRCSICGHISAGQTFCTHTRPRQRTYQMADGKLAYRECMDLNGFETSAVEDPAYVVAHSDLVYDPRKL